MNYRLFLTGLFGISFLLLGVNGLQYTALNIYDTDYMIDENLHPIYNSPLITTDEVRDWIWYEFMKTLEEMAGISIGDYE